MNYIYLEPDDIREFHLAALDRYGGVYGEREPGMIDYMAEKPSVEVFGQECYRDYFLKPQYIWKVLRHINIFLTETNVQGYCVFLFFRA